jgi:hypothetical protein
MENMDRYSAVLLIDANSRAQTMESYQECAQLIQAQDPHVSRQFQHVYNESAVRFVKEWLVQPRSKWLLIFDGLDEPGQFNDYDRYLLRLGVGDILVTSRQETAQHLRIGIAIGPMAREEAIKLLLHLALGADEDPIDEHKTQAAEIADFLSCLPLGLELAGSYIRHALRGDLKCYLEWIESDSEHFYSNLAADSCKNQFLSSYNFSIFATWQKSLDCIGEAAKNFIHLCGFIDQTHLNVRFFQDATRVKYHWSQNSA